MDTFTWCPRINPQGSITLRVLTAQFGDGYQQNAADGINSKTGSWPLEFVGSAEEIKPIADFLDVHGGWQRFLWTAPLSVAAVYLAGTYTVTPMGGDLYTLSVTLQQVAKV